MALTPGSIAKYRFVDVSTPTEDTSYGSHCGAKWAQIEKVRAYMGICKEFSYSHHFWPDDSQWGFRKLN